MAAALKRNTSPSVCQQGLFGLDLLLICVSLMAELAQEFLRLSLFLGLKYEV
jgi:hypothetical protein